MRTLAHLVIAMQTALSVTTETMTLAARLVTAAGESITGLTAPRIARAQ